MSPFLPPLAFLPEYPTVLETLGYQAVGLVVVFTALGLIWLLLEAMSAWFRRLAAHRVKSTPAPAAPAAAPSEALAKEGPTQSEPPVAVIIAAAVHTVMRGRRHRIVSITTAPEHQAWSVEGRRHIFSSHKVR
jgi:Na+-transporting methylmalonyl-CoA/oxaloacetate decarboxylase gamma subunit